MLLSRKFYNQKTLQAAQNLLGCFLVREIKNKIIRAMITDVEAYVGEDDLASHASKGRTPRTEIMYGEAGHAYVYLVYGMHHVMNIVTEKKDFPAAVMLRGVKIENIDYARTNGPGKLCKVLQIDRQLNGWDLTKGEKLWIEKGEQIKKENIKTGPRIGIDYAQHCKHYLWRFYVEVDK